MAAFRDQLQEGFKISPLQGCNLPGHPGIVLIEVDGSQHRPVAAGFPQLGDSGIEISLIDLGQYILAEMGADGLQFLGDGGIFIGQVRMIRAGINDAQRMAAGRI